MMKKHLHLLIWLALVLALVYTRLVNLSWGLPYPMHPDERNMVIAVIQLRCPEFPSIECFNPHFFAYGQFPLYLAYVIASVFQFFSNEVTPFLGNQAVVLALRYMSAISSIFTVWILVKCTVLLGPFASRSLYKVYGAITSYHETVAARYSVEKTSEYFVQKYRYYLYIITLLFIFSPGLIQFAHFGTTESMLMLFYTLLLYLSIRLLLFSISLKRYVLLAGVVGGLALATKVSAAVFLFIPLVSLGWYATQVFESRRILQYFFTCINLISVALLFFILFSPFNIISLPEFLGAMKYESDVATGSYRAFYTRQFIGTIPVLFQFNHIFPYVLGLPVFLFSLVGLLFLPYNRLMNLLRISFIVYFIPSAFLFAKWTRFMAPIFPLMILFAVLVLTRVWYRARWEISTQIKDKVVLKLARIILYITLLVVCVVCSLPGIAFVSVYTQRDVRFTASEWVYKYMPVQSVILSETANVVDIPVPDKKMPLPVYEHKVYNYSSFNFYDLDINTELQSKLADYERNADYVFMPSRRIFMNHTCLTEYNDVSKLTKENRVDGYSEICTSREQDYPELNSYYRRLFSGKSGFRKVVEFSSYPKIELFGIKLVEFRDEEAEESWTVFDHPVIRIYKRV